MSHRTSVITLKALNSPSSVHPKISMAASFLIIKQSLLDIKQKVQRKIRTPMNNFYIWAKLKMLKTLLGGSPDQIFDWRPMFLDLFLSEFPAHCRNQDSLIKYREITNKLFWCINVIAVFKAMLHFQTSKHVGSVLRKYFRLKYSRLIALLRLLLARLHYCS